MKVIFIRVTDELAQSIKDAALKDRRSVNQWVGIQLEKALAWLSRNGKS